MTPKSPTISDTEDFQAGIVDYAVAGKLTQPFHERASSWEMENLKQAMDEADEAASNSPAPATDKHNLILAAAIYRDGLHCLAGRQEMRQAGLRRVVRVSTVNHADFTTLNGGKTYA